MPLSQHFHLHIRAALCLVMSAWIVLGSTAAAAEDKLVITSAYVVPTQGVYLLNARLYFSLPEAARQAIQDGVALTLHAEIELQRNRRWWLDEKVAALEQEYEVVYHALSESFLLRNLNSGEQTTYNTFDSALDALASLQDVPVIDQALLDGNEQYEMRLRVVLDLRTLPEALRMVLFWANNWRQRSDWRVWPLS
jgi:Domain of unknown function (DUF4390)